MQEHKDKIHKGQIVKVCQMCWYIANSKESFMKQQRKHQAELEVGSMKQYPMNVYKFICNPCELSFRTIMEDQTEWMPFC